MEQKPSQVSADVKKAGEKAIQKVTEAAKTTEKKKEVDLQRVMSAYNKKKTIRGDKCELLCA